MSGCFSKCMNRLQLVQNVAARGFAITKMFDYIQVKLLIDYKILLMVDKIVNCLSPQYLIDFLSGKGRLRVLPCPCNLLNLLLVAVIAFGLQYTTF